MKAVRESSPNSRENLVLVILSHRKCDRSRQNKISFCFFFFSLTIQVSVLGHLEFLNVGLCSFSSPPHCPRVSAHDKSWPVAEVGIWVGTVSNSGFQAPLQLQPLELISTSLPLRQARLPLPGAKMKVEAMSKDRVPLCC